MQINLDCPCSTPSPKYWPSNTRNPVSAITQKNREKATPDENRLTFTLRKLSFRGPICQTLE